MSAKQIIKIGVGVLVVVAVVLIGYWYFSRGQQTSQQQQRTAKVEKGTIVSTLSETGTVISANQVDLNFDNPGKLTNLAVGLNSAVTTGQQLATLHPTDTKIADQTLTSPIDGTVIHIGASVGEVIGTSSSTTSTSRTSTSSSGGAASPAIDTPGIITIADLNNLQVKLGVDQADISKVAVGQAATINLDAVSDKEFTGNVISIDPIPVSNQNVITYTVYVSVVGTDSRVRLGMTANVKLNLGKKDNVLLVPNLAIRTVKGKKVVKKIVDGVPTDVNVEVGLSDETNTEIVSGLLEGDTVVLGTLTVSSGAGGGTSRSSSRMGGGFFGPR